ncbi:Uma2 family endonuclease [Actinoplanes sp. NPDC049599]|uniref:Uma2 family endonuclease n=1 Tax=Actinoplanes sp. NPDC049599 TaxID=3363903 RepID=UPI003792CB9C
MISAILEQGTPVTEEEFFALGETSKRVELFDGSLYMTPAPTPQHQHISSELKFALRTAARTAGLYVHEAVNVRLQPGRIPIPDLVVTGKIDFKELVIDAGAVVLICEIVSPSNASADRVLKMHYYAAAGIPWYLLVEQESAALHLYQLSGNHYVERSVTRPGEVLHLDEPLTADLVPEDLLPPD